MYITNYLSEEIGELTDSANTVLDALNNKYDICIYTGNSIEEVKKHKVKNFSYIKCGTYSEDKKQISGNTTTDKDYIFTLASSNQNFYDSNYKLLSKNGVLTTKRR